MNGLASQWSDPRQLIQDAADALGDEGRSLARLLLDDYPASALRPAAELLRASGLPYRALADLAAAAGFDGLAELQWRVREEQDRELRTPRQRYTARIGAGGAGPLVERAAGHEAENVRRTLRELAAGDDLERAASAIAAARTRYLVGERKSHAFALLLAADLSAVLPDVHVLGDRGGRDVDALLDAGPADVAVAFGMRRYSTGTLDLVRALRGRGVPVVGVTDAPDSPLAGLSDHVLVAATASTSFTDSPTAVAATVHALSLVVAARTKGARRRLARREEAARALSVYREP
ncbi:SIS domain-containing protein [Streptacidiphilus sp. ASG 303]|uniref:MurR/RpiR family transcriptional regulator n=1 Tax=Streptacidiphilus sp. ASG 303 TaxID=2896847 RepID=UPI001E63A58E|nr:SIS domain-containing protein [Streptacidiphilus sp. ASG 303]MCD0484395.1 SIS domain-containing protein [Streptacidiphilus sp. ASG 303]